MITNNASRVKSDLARMQRASTVPLQADAKSKKRIILCCDGTWQDGVDTKECWKHSNILKLSRAIGHVDERSGVPVHQITYYQKGIGTAHNIYSQYVEGATGLSLIDKVQDAYAFISQNYCPGDEIFLFGFSRGAYTARMVAMFIGAIGVLDRTDMDQFPNIFCLYQALGKETDPIKIEKLKESLSKWTSHDSNGKRRADSDDDSYSIKCVGVFDTVGSVGLPEELTHKSPSTKSMFGFPNNELGEHVERTYHALAIDETRLDFDCCKFQQTDGGRRKGQILEQCWFSGSHADIGGGWPQHDLSDLTLVWMVANVSDILFVDTAYIFSLPAPVALWGEQHPNDPRTGIFALSEHNVRKLPTVPDDRTHETIHPSVLQRKTTLLQKTIDHALVCKLLPLEKELQKTWPYIEGKHVQDESNGAMLSFATVHCSLFGNLALATAIGMNTSYSTVQAQVSRPLATNVCEQSQPSRFASLRTMCREFLLTSG